MIDRVISSILTSCTTDSVVSARMREIASTGEYREVPALLPSILAREPRDWKKHLVASDGIQESADGNGVEVLERCMS